MAYTVNKLAKLSGVSVRTLHYYDEIGLLKPAYYGENNYRYYESEQLLLLQQILFYRELQVPLHEIQRILSSDSFDKIAALQSHKQSLEQDLSRFQKMITTINKTIAHLKGEQLMNDNELYYGFDSEKQKQHEKDLVANGIVSQEFMDAYQQKTNQWTNQEKNAFIQDIERIMQGLIMAINNNLAPDTTEVQNLMREHYSWLNRSWTPNKESYLGLINLYQTPEFRVFYDERHPLLLDFIIKAMAIFAEQTLF